MMTVSLFVFITQGKFWSVTPITELRFLRVRYLFLVRLSILRKTSQTSGQQRVYRKGPFLTPTLPFGLHL